MATVLFIAVGLSIFFAVLKLADSIRDIAFEIREARRTMERNATHTQDFQTEFLTALKARPALESTRASLEAFLGEAPVQGGAPDLDRTDEFAQISG